MFLTLLPGAQYMTGRCKFNPLRPTIFGLDGIAERSELGAPPFALAPRRSQPRPIQTLIERPAAAARRPPSRSLSGGAARRGAARRPPIDAGWRLPRGRPGAEHGGSPRPPPPGHSRCAEPRRLQISVPVF